MNLQSMFRDFNPGKFIVWVCLATFTALLALRFDNELDWSFWVVFSPIWVWKALVVVGALIGNIVWWKNPHYRLEGQSYIQYRALLISLGLHLFLLMFEVLAADNLENKRHAWVSVFAPLILISIVSIAACIWAVKHDRSFEIVFVPAWILMCVSVVAVLYSIIFAGVLLRMPDVNPDRRRTSMNSAIGYTCLVAPLLIFLITLASKMNGNTSATYTSVVSPLYISYVTLILMSFTTKRANQWWFGLRKDLCQFLLGVCPLLQEYANISYSIPHVEESQTDGRSPTSAEAGVVSSEKKDVVATSRRLEHRVVIPALSLDVPD
ncbi:transmembrane protein 185B-like isoform X3 [Panulirus ornatus]|uniref:transmembrane protein 185B-like isoform X3 n=1 Tax=Panulirus ornatus TaxID=150431 RepID=UPI003A847D5F